MANLFNVWGDFALAESLYRLAVTSFEDLPPPQPELEVARQSLAALLRRNRLD